MKQGLYNRRVEAFKKAKAEWQAKGSHPAVSFIALAASISRLVGMVT